MLSRRLSAILLAFALVALLVPASAPAAKRSAKAAPKITSVTPMRVTIGTNMTIRGTGFSSRRTRNTVIFRAPNGRTAFVKPRAARRGRLSIRVPSAVTRLLSLKNGRPAPTRFKLRVLSGRFGKFTTKRLSPVVVPLGFGGIGGPGAPGGSAAPCGSGDDWDGDLLSNGFEPGIGTDPCLKDTDLDGIEDGFEYKSAVDLNNDEYQEPNDSKPYPGKRPYPNALDPSDGGVDYDGDGLSQGVEQRLWKFSTSAASRTLFPLTYSDGLQHSVYQNLPGQGDRRFPALAAAGYPKQDDFVQWAQANGYRDVYVPFRDDVFGLFDINLDNTESPQEGVHYDRDGDGWLSDEQRDEDADGLSNLDENAGRTQPTWWSRCYAVETPYYVRYGGTDLTDPDTDGDGVRDGADDQDHDDLPNLMELSRIAASGLDDREPGGKECELSEAIRDAVQNDDPPQYWHDAAYGRVDPFNPCLPVASSRTCNDYPTFGASWAPFDDSPNWFSLN